MAQALGRRAHLRLVRPAAVVSPKTGKTRTARRTPSCSSPPSASCYESYAVQWHDFRQTLTKLIGQSVTAFTKEGCRGYFSHAGYQNRSTANRIWSKLTFSNKTPASVLVLGSGTAQLISILTSPIIARLYDPTAFGEFSVFVAAASILGSISSLKLDHSLYLSRGRVHHGEILWLCVLTAISTSAFWGGIAFLLQLLPAQPFKTPWLQIAAILAGVLLVGFVSIAGAHNTKYRRFKVEAASVACGAAANATITIAFAYFVGGGFVGLALGYLASLVVTLGVSNIGSSSPSNFLIFKKTGLVPPPFERLLALFSRYQHFATFSVGTSIINQASFHFPILAIAVIHGPAAAGAYALASRIVQAPMGLVGRALTQDFLSRLPAARQRGTEAALTASSFHRACVLISIPALVVGLFAPGLFAWAFGDEWFTAGQYAQLLAPVVFTWFVTAPIAGLYIIFERQREEVKFQTSFLAMRLIAVIGGLTNGNAYFLVACISAAGTTAYLGLLFSLLKISGNRMLPFAKNALLALLQGLALMLPAILAQTLSSSNWLLTLVLSGIAYSCHVGGHFLGTRGEKK